MLLQKERLTLAEICAGLETHAAEIDRMAGDAMRQPLPPSTASLAQLYCAMDHVRRAADMLAPLTLRWPRD